MKKSRLSLLQSPNAFGGAERKASTEDRPRRLRKLLWAQILFCLLTISCRQSDSPAPKNVSPVSVNAIDPLAPALAPHSGPNRVDQEIVRLQKKIRDGKNLDTSIERLGWSFVAKARESFDPGFYRLAEQCAVSLDKRHPGSLEAMLLRGHVLHNLHRFKEAEPLARTLVAQRGLPFDFGLLSDVLMEQGKLAEAAESCQKMIDLRPDLHSYARGAHLRWLKGSVTGARDLMAMAATAASPRDPESAAWVNTRLAGYEFQCGSFAEAERACAMALDFQSDYPPALLLRGKMLLAQDNPAAAVDSLRRAVELNPLPEYQWALAEALTASTQVQEAAAVEVQLSRKGAVADPRTYALYLASRNQAVDLALRLAESEMNSRADVFTHDALAWASLAAGRNEDARRHSKIALGEGTTDPRLFFHAAVIAHKTGEDVESQQWAAKAMAQKQMLLPCEREQLEAVAKASALSVALKSPIKPQILN